MEYMWLPVRDQVMEIFANNLLGIGRSGDWRELEEEARVFNASGLVILTG